MKLFRLFRMVQSSTGLVLSGSSAANFGRPSGMSYATALILVVFMLGTNYAGVLSGSFTEGRQLNYNLTAANTEWAVWGQGDITSLSPSDRSLGGTGISDLTHIRVGNLDDTALRGLGQFGDIGTSSFQWSDGTTAVSASNVDLGLQFVPLGEVDMRGYGFSFTAIASTDIRKLTLFAVLNDGKGELTASLSDNSAAPLSLETTSSNQANRPFTFTVDYQASSANQLLTITWKVKDYGAIDATNAAIQAVALYTTPRGEVPEPTSMAIFGLGAVGMAYRARRKSKA